MRTWLEQTKEYLSAVGINTFAVADGSPYQHILPGCRSVIVVANGGTSMWEHFVAHLRANPEQLSAQQHPLDNFVAHHIQRADPEPNDGRRWIRCAATETEFVDFRLLGQQANLGHRSHLGLLMHPTYGLWISFRAAVFTTEFHPPSPLPEAINPCDSCRKFCVGACPGNAFTDRGWQVSLCASFHQTNDDCNTSCHSRLACPEGAEHQHSKLQHHYHSSRSTGRQLIAEILRIEDKQSGLDPRWREWSVDK